MSRINPDLSGRNMNREFILDCQTKAVLFLFMISRIRYFLVFLTKQKQVNCECRKTYNQLHC